MKRLAILIGNGKFPADSGLASLAGPANDALRLAETLENPELGGFSTEVHVDEQSHTIQAAVQRKLHDAQADDLVMIYYAGHGKLDIDGQLHLTAANTNLDLLQATSFPLLLMKTMITQSRSKRIVLILDCCFSGAAEKAFLRSGGSIDEPLIDVAEGGGIHIFSSTTKFQTAKEKVAADADGVYGEFTSHVVEGIRTGAADIDGDGKITLQELRQYVEKNIQGQRPRYCGLESEGDLQIARNPNPKPLALADDVKDAVSHPRAAVRLGIVRDLLKEARSAHAGRSLAAIGALRKLSKDDSKEVSLKAHEALLAVREGDETDDNSAPDGLVVQPSSTTGRFEHISAYARRFAVPAAAVVALVLVVWAAYTGLAPEPSTGGGALFVNATPWARVTAIVGEDNTERLQSSVETPVTFTLPPGNYTVNLLDASGQVVSESITIERGGAHRIVKRGAVDADAYLAAAGFKR